MSLSLQAQENVDHFLKGAYQDADKNKLLRELKEKPQEVERAFSKTLQFGTGGIRGLMGLGTNRLNEYTIEAATQGLCHYILSQKRRAPLRVFISYDNRHHSFFFAKLAARVLAANKIEAYIVKNLRPTPLCSFGCIYYHCIAAIMITASHNPPEYNGYKVYWDDGAQVLPPHDKAIIKEYEKIRDPSQVKLTGLKDPLIHWVGEELDEIYIKTARSLQNYPENNRKNGSKLKIIYSNLHGAGITLVPQTLHDWGFKKIQFVKEQLATDGSFPGAKKPNPEEREALEPGVRVLLDKEADLLMASDPDSDRIGVVIRHQSQAISFTGNQIAAILLYHLMNTDKIPENAAFVKTIVTTELFKKICDHYQKKCFDVLTGFKYIAEKIREFEKSKEYKYVFGAEESLGYLAGSFVRDKDASTAAALIAEATLYAKGQKLNLYQLLQKIYAKFGVFREKLRSIAFDHPEKMKGVMETIRKDSIEQIAGLKVVMIEDYLTSIAKDLNTGKETKLTLPKSNVLRFWLEDRSKVVIRPSGTEPKIKIYAGIEKQNFKSVDTAIKEGDELLDKLIQDLERSFHA